MLSLDKVPIGKAVKIIKVNGEGNLRCRLLDMGLIPRTQVTVIKFAPMGDPIEIRLRGYELTIRKEQASNIVVQYIEDSAKDNNICASAEKVCANENKGGKSK